MSIKRAYIICILILLTIYSSSAQPKIRIYIDGLTCSSCLKTCDIYLSKISYLEKIVSESATNLDSAYLEYQIVDTTPILDLFLISKQIRNAGFSLGKIYCYIPIASQMEHVKLGKNEFPVIKGSTSNSPYFILYHKRLLNKILYKKYLLKFPRSNPANIFALIE